MVEGEQSENSHRIKRQKRFRNCDRRIKKKGPATLIKTDVEVDFSNRQTHKQGACTADQKTVKTDVIFCHDLLSVPAFRWNVPRG